MAKPMRHAAAKYKRRLKEAKKRRDEFQRKIASGDVPEAYRTIYPVKEQRGKDK